MEPKFHADWSKKRRDRGLCSNVLNSIFQCKSSKPHEQPKQQWYGTAWILPYSTLKMTSPLHTQPCCIFFDSWRPRWSNGCPPSTVTEAQLFPSPQFTLFWGFSRSRWELQSWKGDIQKTTASMTITPTISCAVKTRNLFSSPPGEGSALSCSNDS